MFLGLQLPVDRRIDQHPRPLSMAVLHRVSLVHGHAGVQHRAGGSGEERDVTHAGIDAIGERPLNRFPVEDIDVFIDDNEMLGGVVAQVRAPEGVGHLLGMAAVTFADLDPHHFGPLAAPHTQHVGNPRLFEVVPRHRRIGRRRPCGPFVGSPRTRSRQASVEDRIVSISDAAHADRMFGRFPSTVVAGVLAERPL